MASGGQPGNNNAANGKLCRDALRKALVVYKSKDRGVKKKQVLAKIFEGLIELALDGERWAIEEISNRLDGKPTEHVEVADLAITADELSDDQLAAIAASGGTTTSTKTRRKGGPSSVH